MCVPTGGLLAALAVVFGTAVAFAPVPRITWEHQDADHTEGRASRTLNYFHEPGIFNYSALLLSEDKDTLYVGAREAVFALNAHNISRKLHETECLNYIRVLQPLSANALYVCGTNAFQPACDHLSLTSFQFLGKNEDGKGRCPFDPAQSYTSVMVGVCCWNRQVHIFQRVPRDGGIWLPGAPSPPACWEPQLSSRGGPGGGRPGHSVGTGTTRVLPAEPSFVFSDVIRESLDDGEDDRVYFFFTEVSVEYEFVFKLLIPRVARVCKGDQGGLRTLQKKWTSFLKARLICSRPESNLVFNVLRDVFVLRAPGLKEPVFYGCINREARAANLSSSLNLPDKTLQFVKDHPLMDDSVTPVDNRPQLVKTDANYTQIVVDRTQALDGTVYDVMFVSTGGSRALGENVDRGALHKAINLENDVHIIEETQLFQDFEPVQTLLLSSKKQVPSRAVDTVHVYFDVPDKVKESYRQHFFKRGGTAELKCSQKSNLARVVWKFRDSVLKVESPKYSLVGRKNLLIFDLSEGDSGVYQCLSEERVRNKTVLQVVAKHVLEVKVVPRTPAASAPPATRTEGGRITPKMSLGPTQGSPPQTPAVRVSTPSAVSPPSRPAAPTSTSCEPKIVINTVPQVHSEKTMYLKSSDNRLFMSLCLLFFVLFLCLLTYNCYKGYLPGQCLKFRSAVFLGKKKPALDFSDCEQSGKETLVEQGSFSQQNGGQPKPALDTGYETEQDTMASRVPTDREDSQRMDELPGRDKPFDVKCELQFADSDADGD
ncbi:semaphorin-4D isoform 1 precursor [Camelus ferus]|nr:semaphorin-4D isoform 1 precursor [Camelus ferus]